MKSPSNFSAASNIPLSIPAPGRTIQSLVAGWEKAVITVYKRLIQSAEQPGLVNEIIERYDKTFSPIIQTGMQNNFSQKSKIELASAAVISIWMIAKYNLSTSYLTFDEAEKWFFGDYSKYNLGLSLKEWFDDNTFNELSNRAYDKGFFDLLPYILELFHTDNGLVDDESYRNDREKRKRKEGIFYTPSDLADYLIEEVGTDWDINKPSGIENSKWLDSACGAGVFFIAILRWAKRNNINDLLSFSTKSLYGIDINAHAIQSCAFTITNFLLSENIGNLRSPWNIWQLIRSNLAIADATLISGIGCSNSDAFQLLDQERLKLKDALVNNSSFYREGSPSPSISKDVHQPTQLLSEGKLFYLLGDIFPECKDGVDYFVGNPPYSVKQDIQQSNDRYLVYKSSSLGSEGNIYTLFIEMMWKFTQKDNAKSGLVIPLSIAYNTDFCFRTIRILIQKSNYKFRFSFFDRTPDSLFGDAVKTRNCTIIMQKGVFPETNIETGPIIRWNSRTRKHLFSNINHVKFDNLPIVEFIPKLGSDLEQNVYKTLLKSHEKIGWMWNGISINHFDVNEKVLNRIYFYNVAYNWLSIFRELPKDQDGVVSVSSSLKGLSCKDEVEASFAFVILSSRLAYWLWRVEGDGFHLNLSFLNRIPINISHFPPEIINKLVALSKELWITQLENPIESFNSGKKTINYSPEKSERIIDEIDKVIIRGLNLPESFIDYLKSFYLDNIIVGRQEEIQEKGQREKSNNG